MLTKDSSGSNQKFQPNSYFMKKLNKGEITCYKVYDKHSLPKTHLNDYLSAIVKYQTIRAAGVVNSDRPYKELSLSELKYGVCRGIHVFTSLKSAKKFIIPNTSEIIVPVICRKSDFIAQGMAGQAAFMKVRIRSRTWNKIFAKKVKC